MCCKRSLTALAQSRRAYQLLGNPDAWCGVQIKQQNNLAVGDFPNVNTFRDILSVFDLSQLPKITERMIKTVDEVLMVEIPLLVNKFSNPY